MSTGRKGERPAQSHEGGKQGHVWEMSRTLVVLQHKGCEGTQREDERIQAASNRLLRLASGFPPQPSEQESALARKRGSDGQTELGEDAGPGWWDGIPGIYIIPPQPSCCPGLYPPGLPGP